MKRSTMKQIREALLEDPRSVSDFELLNVYLFNPGFHDLGTGERILSESEGLAGLLQRVRAVNPRITGVGPSRMVSLKAVAELARRFHRNPKSPGTIPPLDTSELPPVSMLGRFKDDLLTDASTVSNLGLLAVMVGDRDWPRVITEILRETRELRELFEILSKGIGPSSPFRWRALLASSLVAGVEMVHRYHLQASHKLNVDATLFTPAVLDLLESLLLQTLHADPRAQTLASTAQRLAQLDDYFHWLAGEELAKAAPEDDSSFGGLLR